jgi:hypothetical protein
MITFLAVALLIMSFVEASRIVWRRRLRPRDLLRLCFAGLMMVVAVGLEVWPGLGQFLGWLIPAMTVPPLLLYLGVGIEDKSPPPEDESVTEERESHQRSRFVLACLSPAVPTMIGISTSGSRQRWRPIDPLCSGEKVDFNRPNGFRGPTGLCNNYGRISLSADLQRSWLAQRSVPDTSKGRVHASGSDELDLDRTAPRLDRVPNTWVHRDGQLSS